jgi:hypothetical protein
MLRDKPLVIYLLLALLATGNLGCGSAGDAAQSGEKSHVRLLTMLYAKASLKLRRPPRDEQEFKQTLASSNTSLEPLNVDSIDDLFISERDGQPLVVRYLQLPTGSDVVVYEQTGMDGKRLVGHKIGMIEELDDAQFSALNLKK